ncbi:MAG: DUF4326 domain-containing protein, partial [Rhodospirillales bacterium]|nr:DUF4326 domain-containing protein [Rhodospirillales bacterium]
RDLWRRIRAGEVDLEDLAALDGRDLCCWCADLPCHADVLARAAAWAAQVQSTGLLSPIGTPLSPRPRIERRI